MKLPSIHRARPGLHALSFKLAVAVTLAAAVPAFAAWAWYAVPAVQAAAGATGLGLVTYAVAYGLLARRLELAYSILKQIRRHQFDNLKLARLPHGDELNALIWQVYRTGQALEKEIREMKKMENYRREFIGNVSHELKTPIFAIQGFAETLLDGALEDERVNRAFLQKILHNTGRLANLVRDLSEISKIETGELEMVRKPFDLRRVVREVVESMEHMAAAKDVALRASLPETLPRVMGDRERIQQVLINLVDNAIKYNNAGGHVEVTARGRPDGEVEIAVVDDGIGIAPQHIPRLTERFYRVDKSRSRRQGGTGLGLAIVKHIIGAHDRRLLIESRPGRGSTFAFTLEAAPPESGGERG
ncbi:sensor histidine kinase [Rhodothermaceae bacterium RA]|nr:sensor histidine kinase [Rhodothermaceae bacterium RA]